MSSVMDKHTSLNKQNTLAYYGIPTLRIRNAFVVQTPWTCTIKLFTAVIVHIHSRLIFVGKDRRLTELHSNSRLLALAANVRLGWKWIAVANTQASYHTATITENKKAISAGPWSFLWANFTKNFTNVIRGVSLYDHGQIPMHCRVLRPGLIRHGYSYIGSPMRPYVIISFKAVIYECA